MIPPPGGSGGSGPGGGPDGDGPGRDQPDGTATATFLVRTDAGVEAVAAIDGVEDHHALTDDLILVETTLTRSRLYHEVKWAGPGRTPLVVAELTTRPKATSVAPGAVAWIRDHLPG